MYICICNEVTERQIRDAVDHHGIKRVSHLKRQLGACSQCGKCAAAAKQVLDDCLTQILGQPDSKHYVNG